MLVEKQINYLKNIHGIIHFPLKRDLIKPDCYLILHTKFKFLPAKKIGRKCKRIFSLIQDEQGVSKQDAKLKIYKEKYC